MRNKVIFVTLLVAALALSACAPTVVSGGETVTRQLSVTGVGEVALTPDIAYIYIGVHTEGDSASGAVDANNLQTQAVIEALKDRGGVAEEDIRTTNFSIWPSTTYDPETGQPSGTIYAVDNTVYVTVRDLDSLGELLDATIEAGANSINSIQFDVADKTEELKEARAKAVENASEMAQELAEAAGVTLGDIQSISFYDSVPYPYFDGKGGGGYALEAAVPIQPGQMTLMVTVNISYEIK